MTAAQQPAELPPWTVVRADDPRGRPDAVETSSYVSGEWAASIRAASNRAWTNAAKVIATLVPDRPEARYVEGWAYKGLKPEWHAWVDIPLTVSERAWLRIDATPLWRWLVSKNAYGAVLEVRAADMAPFAAPLLRRRGRALCRLPLVQLVPRRKFPNLLPQPTESLRDDFGDEVADRSAEVLQSMVDELGKHEGMVHVDVRAELDRFAAMRVLPRKEE